jgi:hypothetical protein
MMSSVKPSLKYSCFGAAAQIDEGEDRNGRDTWEALPSFGRLFGRGLPMAAGKPHACGGHQQNKRCGRRNDLPSLPHWMRR